jgi:hypothetical protein
MSLIVGQILIPSEDFPAATGALTDYLDLWFREQYRPHPRPPFTDGEGIRSVILLPPLDGWMAVLERRSDLCDLELAAALSRALPVPLTVFELDGSRYRWARYEFQAGSPRDAALEPPDAFEPRHWAPLADRPPEPAPRPMPRYRDVETEATAHFLRRGVPADLLFLRHEDVSAGTAAEAVFFKLWQREDGPAFRHYPFRAAVEPVVRDAQTPLHYDHVELKTDVSQQLVRETRHVYGEPTDEAVENLARLEDAFRSRVLARESAECRDELLPDVRFLYRHETAEQPFARMLRRARATRRTGAGPLYHGALFSRAGFRRRAAEALREARPDRPAREGEDLQLLLGPHARPWDLAPLYQRYLREPERLRPLLTEAASRLD